MLDIWGLFVSRGGDYGDMYSGYNYARFLRVGSGVEDGGGGWWWMGGKGSIGGRRWRDGICSCERGGGWRR